MRSKRYAADVSLPIVISATRRWNFVFVRDARPETVFPTACTREVERSGALNAMR
jgi:hypothetical protein